MEQYFGLILYCILGHAVLSVLTYRDAKARDNAVPVVWAGTVLLTGIVGFLGYFVLRSPKIAGLAPDR